MSLCLPCKGATEGTLASVNLAVEGLTYFQVVFGYSMHLIRFAASPSESRVTDGMGQCSLTGTVQPLAICL